MERANGTRRMTARKVATTAPAVICICAIAALGFLATRGIATDGVPPRPIAVVDFDYSDTSGEVRDQVAEHTRLLGAFMTWLRRDLAAEGKFRVVEVSCGGRPCASTDTSETLENAAKSAGAKLLLLGGIHKQSTLVQWVKVQLVDIEGNRLILERLLTFRGDSDEAWQRAERFIVGQIRDKLALR